MSKRSRILLILVLGGMCVALELLALRPRGPVYAGKPLDEWLEQIRPADYVLQEGTPSEAVYAIRGMGAAAVPRLMEMMRARDSRLRRWIMDVCKKQA